MRRRRRALSGPSPTGLATSQDLGNLMTPRAPANPQGKREDARTVKTREPHQMARFTVVATLSSVMPLGRRGSTAVENPAEVGSSQAPVNFDVLHLVAVRVQTDSRDACSVSPVGIRDP